LKEPFVSNGRGTLAENAFYGPAAPGGIPIVKRPARPAAKKTLRRQIPSLFPPRCQAPEKSRRKSGDVWHRKPCRWSSP